MKRSIALLLALLLIVSTAFTACKRNEEDVTDDGIQEVTGLDDADTIIGFEDVEVTDENGETVTDKNGEPVTEEVAVEYATNNKGKTKAYVLDANGDRKKDKNGKDVTLKNSKTADEIDASRKNTKSTSQKETEKNTKIERIPIIHLKTGPPRYSAISTISEF